MAVCPGLPGWTSTRKVKAIWIFLKQETMSGISWAICKSAPCSRETTTPAPHYSVFYGLDALPATQPKASKHWRYPRYLLIKWFLKNQLQLELEDPSNAEQLQYQQHAILTPAQDTDGREIGETGRWRIEEWAGEGRKGRGEKREGKMRNRRQKG